MDILTAVLAVLVAIAILFEIARRVDVPYPTLFVLGGLGLAFLTMGARLIPAAEVALITLLEVVLGPVWVWIALSERPSTATLVGGVIVIAAVVLQAGGDEPEVVGAALPAEQASR